MMLTFAEFLPALFEALGGEEIPRASDAPLPAAPAAGRVAPGMADWRPSNNKESPCVP